MAKEQTNDELNLRRKARRRLIGAVALTLAVVVILPMVLDSEPKPVGQDIELRIPDKDKAGEFRVRFKAANGNVLFSTEGYTSKSGATGLIESVKKNAPEAETDDQT